MNILWIPHSPLQPGSIRRDQHLIRHLRGRHRIISVEWETRNDASLLQSLKDGMRFFRRVLRDGRTSYHVRRIPDVTRRIRRNPKKAIKVNEFFFRRDIRRIVVMEEVDVLITAYSEFMTGEPPFDLEVPIIFDYLDCADWSQRSAREANYIQKSDAVLCVSELAEQQARQFNERVEYLPNGADLERLRNASGQAIRKRYNLGDAPVVSLIGLMDSDYLVDAVLSAKKEIPELMCLLVGRSQRLKAQVDSVPPASNPFIYVGPVPYEEVAGYFAATDVGLYPVPGLPYDDGRCPIKVLEYLASNKLVVSPSIRELQRLDFNNIIFSNPTSESFAEGIVTAFETKVVEEPKIERFDWRNLASRVDEFVRKIHAEYHSDGAFV